MANTTNLNLVKPAGTDYALISTINDNMDKIDTFAGSANQAIANVNPAKTTILTSANVTSDTSIMALADGVYQVASSTSINAYLPSSYGTLVVNKSGNSYGMFVFIGTGSRTFVRSAANSTTWHTEWQELVLKRDIIIEPFTDEVITSGYVQIAYPTGCSYNSHKYFIQPKYKTGNLAGWVPTIQAVQAAMTIYVRQGTTLPADNSKISFDLFCVAV